MADLNSCFISLFHRVGFTGRSSARPRSLSHTEPSRAGPHTVSKTQ